MKKIAYTAADGTTAIVIPSPKDRIEKILGPLTEQEYEAHVLARSIPPDATNVREIDDEDLPVDREFRNAWKIVPGVAKLQIDPEMAKADYEKRLPGVLLALDNEARKLELMGDDATVVRARISQLQNVKASLKNLNATTVEDLKAALPNISEV